MKHDAKDPITNWLIANNFPVTLRNWLDIAYWRRVKLSELDAEAIAEIPNFLLPKKYRRFDRPMEAQRSVTR